MSGQLGFRFLMLVVKSIALSDGKTEVMYRKNSFCMKAIEFLALIKKDPKNLYRKGELDCCIDELRDYFMGEIVFFTKLKKKCLQKHGKHDNISKS